MELSVAVGVSAIVATAGIVATTAFIGSAQDKRDSYTSNANSAIENAEASSLALGASGLVEDEIVPSTDKAATTTILASTGETVLGTDVTVSASGLKPGAAYTIVLQSDPVTLASGTVGATGLLSETVTIPADTPSGWHSITLTSTYYDDTALSNVQWLEIAGDGTLAGTSDTEPVLAATSGNVEFVSFNPTNNVTTYSLDGSTYTAYNEGNQQWSSGSPVLSFAFPLNNGQYSGYLSNGYYMFEQSSTSYQNHYGYWFDSSTQAIATDSGALMFFDNNDVFQGLSVQFDGDPANGGEIVSDSIAGFSYPAAGDRFGIPTQDWHMWFANDWGGTSAVVFGGQGPWSGQGDYCLGCGVGDSGSNVGGLNGWAVKIGNGAWLEFNISEMADGLIFDDGTQYGTWDFMVMLDSVHNVSSIQQGTKVQLRTPDGTYSNIYTMPFTAAVQ